MNSIIVVGADHGDEGKGRVIDLLAEQSDMVVRFAGGANAGHTLVVNGEKTVLRLIPSGVLHQHTECVLAQGMVIDPLVFEAEIKLLTPSWVAGRLFVSDAAHLIMPYHLKRDAENEASATVKIGTTKKGIGPCYADKISRVGIRIGDLADLTLAIERVAAAESIARDFARAVYGQYLERAADILLPYVIDTSKRINDALDRGANVLFEGAQGTLLDIDHGTYPFVTSSSSVAGGACTGSGVGPTKIKKVMGVSKVYSTRVGEGPFPTELHDEIADRIRKAGNEYGSVTGRPRRVGWLDLRALAYAVRVNGMASLALTKFDVLSHMPVTVFSTSGKEYTFQPWGDISNIRVVDDLPPEVQGFIGFVEDELNVAVDMISVGADRKQTIFPNRMF